MLETIRRKTPSNKERDERGKADFLKKKTLASKELQANNDAASSKLREPKDEIPLEKPEVKEIERGKLENNEIHKSIWKTLKKNFSEGVKEFFDGSTCYEKHIIFWGKCRFK